MTKVRRTSRGVTVTGRESAPTCGKPCFPGTQKLAIGLNLSVFHLEAGLTFFFSNQINSQGVFYLPDWFILVHILFRLGSGVSSPCWAWKAVTHRERWCLRVLQHEWGLLSLTSAILFFLVLSWVLTWLLVPKENQRDEYSDIKLSPLLVAQKVFTRNLNGSPRKKGGRRREAELKGQRKRKLFCLFGDVSFVQDRGAFVHK